MSRYRTLDSSPNSSADLGVNQALKKATSLTYDGKVTLKHPRWIPVKDLYVDALKKFVVRPSNRWVIAAFYRCPSCTCKSDSGWQ